MLLNAPLGPEPTLAEHIGPIPSLNEASRWFISIICIACIIVLRELHGMGRGVKKKKRKKSRKANYVYDESKGRKKNRKRDA